MKTESKLRLVKCISSKFYCENFIFFKEKKQQESMEASAASI